MTSLHRFLLVDDDPIFLAIAEMVVASLGSPFVATATDGEQALQVLRETSPAIDVIILDLNMPRLDGLAFLRSASALGFAGQVIISSGESEAILRSAQRMAELLGVSVLGALRKPLNAEAIVALIAGASTTCATKNETAPRLDHFASSTLLPYYQPQYEIQSGRLVGLEALIRLASADGNVYGPGHLFGRINDPAQLVSVSLLIAQNVIADIVKWKSEGLQSRVSINMDANVLEHPDVAAALIEMTRENGIAPEWICFELTETALPKDVSQLLEVLTRLRMGGFHVSLDDYGTGSSNFELLRLCPFSEIKVDTTILQSASADAMSRRFIETTCKMARELDILVVGEGVETVEHLDLAAAAGIQVVQGFLFSEAVPAAAARHLISTGTAREVLARARGPDETPKRSFG